MERTLRHVSEKAGFADTVPVLASGGVLGGGGVPAGGGVLAGGGAPADGGVWTTRLMMVQSGWKEVVDSSRRRCKCKSRSSRGRVTFDCRH